MPHYNPIHPNESLIINGLVDTFTRYCTEHEWTISIFQGNEHVLDAQNPDLYDICCISLRAETLARYNIDPRNIIGLSNDVTRLTETNFPVMARTLELELQRVHTQNHANTYLDYLIEIYNFTTAIGQNQISEHITETFMAYVDTFLLHAWNLSHRMLGQSGFIRRIRQLRNEQNEINSTEQEEEPDALPSPTLSPTGRFIPARTHNYVLTGEQQANVEAFQEEKPKLRKRSDKEGMNDLAHNLTVKYQHCIGIMVDQKTKREKAITISQFFKDKNQLLFMGREYKEVVKEGEPLTKEIVLPYNEGDVLLPKPVPGWVMDESGMYLLELTPGTYLRGISTNNMTLRWLIDAEQIRSGLRLNWTRQLIFNTVRRPLISLEEGLKKKLQWFAITNNTAAVLREKREKEKLFILVHDLCVGEYNFKNKRIKIYRYYEKAKHLLERTLKHECE